MLCRWLGNPTAALQEQSVRCWKDPGKGLRNPNMTCTGGWATPRPALQEQSVRCWNDSASIVVIVTDNCPCVQTDVNTGAVTGINPPCCGDIYHMCVNV